jgi:segregation and condensation protein B
VKFIYIGEKNKLMVQKDKPEYSIEGVPDDAELQTIAEVLLFVSETPVTLDSLKEFIPGVDRNKWKEIFKSLAKNYQDRSRGICIRSVAGGYEMATQPVYDALIRQYLKTERKKGLTLASLETLAIIAYRQPITSSDIEGIRGVGTSGVIKTLLEKHLIKTVGRKPVAGRPFLYSTTREFLRHFGLSSLQELPKIQELGEFVDG